MILWGGGSRRHCWKNNVKIGLKGTQCGMHSGFLSLKRGTMMCCRHSNEFLDHSVKIKLPDFCKNTVYCITAFSSRPTAFMLHCLRQALDVCYKKLHRGVLLHVTHTASKRSIYFVPLVGESVWEWLFDG